MKDKIINNIGKIITLSVIVVISLIWAFIGLKSVLLTIGILTLLSYINTAITTLGNAFIGRDINMSYDIFFSHFSLFIIRYEFSIIFIKISIPLY